MRRFVPLLLALSLFMAACGPATNDDDDGPIPGLDATPVSAGNPTPAAEGGATISFAAWEYELEPYQQLAETFHEQNPDINVIIIPMEDLMNGDPNVPQDQVSQLRQVVSGADTAPAYFIPPEAINARMLLDLKPLMDADASFQADDFYPGVLQRATYSNGTFILPRFVYAQILNYNKDLLKAADVPEPSNDWSWSDLLAASEQVATNNSNAYGFFDYSSGFTALLSEFDARDMQILNTPPADVDLTQPDIVAAVERVKTLFDTRALMSSNYQEGQPDPQQVARDGQIAFFPAELFTSSGPRPIDTANGSAEAEDLPFEIGKIPYPPFNTPLYSNSNVEGFMVSAGTQHPNEAWRWINFLSQQDISQPGGASFVSGRIPARISLAETIGYWDSLDAESKAAYEAALAQQAVQPTQSPDYTVLGSLNQAMYEITTNNTNPEQALGAAQKSLEEQLAQLGTQTPTPEPDTSPIVVATPVPQIAPEGATVIRFDASGYNPSVYRRLARTFNDQNSGYYVEIKATEVTTEPLTLSTVSSRNDCFSWWGLPQSTEDFAALLDLRPLFEGDASFKSDDFPNAVLGQFESNGGIYGLPYSFNVRNLSYNRTMFDSVGVEAPTYSWTPDDFLNTAKALTSGTGNQKQYGYVPFSGGPSSDMLFFINQFGGQLSTGSGKDARPNFADPNVVKALQWYIDLAEVHGVMPEFTIPYRPSDAYEDRSYELVSNGRAGMWFDYGYGSFENGATTPDGQPIAWEAAYAPLPVGGAGLQTGDLWARGFYISATTQQQQGCWEWLKFLSTDVANLGGEFPARISVAESEEYRSQVDERQIKLYETYSEALNQPSKINPGMNALNTANQYGVDLYWFYRAINNTIEKGDDLATGLTQANDLTKEFMDCVAETNKPATCAKQVDPDYDGYNTEDPTETPIGIQPAG